MNRTERTMLKSQPGLSGTLPFYWFKHKKPPTVRKTGTGSISEPEHGWFLCSYTSNEKSLASTLA